MSLKPDDTHIGYGICDVRGCLFQQPVLLNVASSSGRSNISPSRLTHLARLEAEAIHILREVVAECERPVMLYSIGKDSSVMLHLALKAFYPAKLPFPLLHVDTTWKFKEMIAFRDETAGRLGLDLLVHVNDEALAMGVNPFSHGSSVHTDAMNTLVTSIS